MKVALIIVFIAGFAMYWYGNNRLKKLEEERSKEDSEQKNPPDDNL